MASSQIKTCFVTAAFDAKLQIIRDVLHQNDVRILSADEPGAVHSISEAISEAIDRADLVIGVLSQQNSQNVLFELGIAVGRRKRILIFAPPKGDSVPSDLQGYLIVRTSLHNREAIEFALGQVLSAPNRSTPQKSKLAPSARPLGEEANVLLSKYSEIVANEDGRRLEELVAEAIKSSGVDVVAQSSREDRGVDLAVWSDAFQSSIGNPLLVEIKARLRSRADFRRASHHLASIAFDSGSTWGLLLYGDGPTNVDLTGMSPPTVMVVSIREMLQSLRTATFVEIVHDLRHRRVHRVS